MKWCDIKILVKHFNFCFKYSRQKSINKEGHFKFIYKKYRQRDYLKIFDSLEPGEYTITLNSGKLGNSNLLGVD